MQAKCYSNLIMVTDIPETQSTQLEFGFRTPKGDWRPPYPVKTAPLFVWPPRPREALKWVLSYPGFLWPWNSVYLLISIVTWFYLQPALSRCVEFRVGWISQMYLRNLGLLWLTAGGWHLLLYTFKVQGTVRKYDPRWLRVGDRNFLFRSQLQDNIFWTCASGCTLWTAYEVWYMWSAANHLVPYVSWTEHPVYFALWLCAIPFWREFHFYWTHRAIHWKPLYKYIHYLHHKNVNPGPWSGLAMHPLEHIVYFSVIADPLGGAIASDSPILQLPDDGAGAGVYSPWFRGADLKCQTPHGLLLPLPASSLLRVQLWWIQTAARQNLRNLS